jgi:glycosyltransferase involved in cell wall biosynthesis
MNVMLPPPPSPNVVCVCPIKDEAAQLDRFLATASLWATHIVLADQGSTDGSRDVARRYPKVRVIENPDGRYDEQARQRLLIAAAREIPEPRVIVALDADEALSANALASAEWAAAIRSKPGTAIFFDWVNLLPGAARAWIADSGSPWGYVDDGRAHQGTPIHSPRVPFSDQCPRVKLQTVKVLHYQYTDWDLMKRKQMWYQCWETLNSPGLRPTEIYRRYHHMDGRADGRNMVDVLDEWFAAYERLGIAVRQAPVQSTEKWDRRILGMLLEHGARRFAKIDIWAVNWVERLRDLDPDVSRNGASLADPRGLADRAVMAWLRRVQQQEPLSLPNKVVRRMIKSLGW